VAAVARVHSVSVLLFVIVTVVLARSLHRAGAAPSLQQRVQVLLAVLLLQAGVGYAQYFTGVPALLVGIHVLGAVAVWIATLRVVLGMHVRAAAGRVLAMSGAGVAGTT
jgi:cytochrome c oxidase assembly protein subunit 15